jgi:hypothetical protein
MTPSTPTTTGSSARACRARALYPGRVAGTPRQAEAEREAAAGADAPEARPADGPGRSHPLQRLPAAGTAPGREMHTGQGVPRLYAQGVLQPPTRGSSATSPTPPSARCTPSTASGRPTAASTRSTISSHSSSAARTRSPTAFPRRSAPPWLAGQGPLGERDPLPRLRRTQQPPLDPESDRQGLDRPVPPAHRAAPRLIPATRPATLDVDASAAATENPPARARRTTSCPRPFGPVASSEPGRRLRCARAADTRR